MIFSDIDLYNVHVLCGNAELQRFHTGRKSFAFHNTAKLILNVYVYTVNELFRCRKVSFVLLYSERSLACLREGCPVTSKCCIYCRDQTLVNMNESVIRFCIHIVDHSLFLLSQSQGGCQVSLFGSFLNKVT